MTNKQKKYRERYSHLLRIINRVEGTAYEFIGDVYKWPMVSEDGMLWTGLTSKSIKTITRLSCINSMAVRNKQSKVRKKLWKKKHGKKNKQK